MSVPHFKVMLFMLIGIVMLSIPPLLIAKELSEADAIKWLQDKGVQFTLDKEGHATRLMSSGKPELTADDYAKMGALKHLEQIGLNAAPLKNDEWGFLHQLPNLKRVSIWHGKGFSTLEPFSGLTVESLTIGGCMGLRDLNKETPEQHLNAILTLKNLSTLKKGNWYHTPLIPTDQHLEHIVTQCPNLEELRLDFTAPRGFETTITPAGIANLQRLTLQILSFENCAMFEREHFEKVAGIKTLRVLLIDARRSSVPEGLEAFRTARPEVVISVAKPGDKMPPQVPRLTPRS